MYKKDISSAKCPPVVSLPKIASHPDLYASVFNKKLRFGIYIGTNESSRLSIMKNDIFPSL